MKKFIVLLTFVIGFAYSQASQTVDFVEIQKQGMSNTERDNGYTWANSSLWTSKVLDIRGVDSIQLFATAPDSFSVGITAKMYNSSSDTSNVWLSSALDSLRNISGAVTSLTNKTVLGTLTTQFWTNVKASMVGGVPGYIRFVLTFNTTFNHASTGASASEYFRLYAKIYRKPNVSTAQVIK